MQLEIRNRSHFTLFSGTISRWYDPQCTRNNVRWKCILAGMPCKIERVLPGDSFCLRRPRLTCANEMKEEKNLQSCRWFVAKHLKYDKLFSLSVLTALNCIDEVMPCIVLHIQLISRQPSLNWVLKGEWQWSQLSLPLSTFANEWPRTEGRQRIF